MNKTDKELKPGPVDGGKSKKGLSIKVLLIVLAIVFLASGIYLLTHQKPKKNAAAEKVRYEKMIKDTDAAVKAEDLYRKKSILENYLKDPPDNKDYLYVAELRLTDACLTLKNYTCANEAGHKAIKANKKNNDFSIYVLLGDANVATKDYKDAEDFYQQAKTILKASKDTHAVVQLNFVESKLSYVQNVLLKKK